MRTLVRDEFAAVIRAHDGLARDNERHARDWSGLALEGLDDLQAAPQQLVLYGFAAVDVDRNDSGATARLKLEREFRVKQFVSDGCVSSLT